MGIHVAECCTGPVDKLGVLGQKPAVLALLWSRPWQRTGSYAPERESDLLLEKREQIHGDDIKLPAHETCPALGTVARTLLLCINQHPACPINDRRGFLLRNCAVARQSASEVPCGLRHLEHINFCVPSFGFLSN